MAVTIGKSYFEALLRRAQFHTLDHGEQIGPDLSNHITISKAEHDFLIQEVRDYHLLKSALFRGGLTTETLQTLLAGESEVLDEQQFGYQYSGNDKLAQRQNFSVASSSPFDEDTSKSESSANNVCRPQARASRNPIGSRYDEACTEGSPIDEDDEHNKTQASNIPFHDQRTILISNLPERTTHKDLTDIIRGGQLLDIYLRNDRTACVSFVQGAADFLSFAKRQDIYLHTKRLEFRWADRQFHVPPHVSNKILGGATRNLVVKGIAGKITANQIRDHLDHIHNLVVVDIGFKNGDALISTNSIHNALFARTCMMSRTAYKGSRIEYCPDACAEPLPQPKSRPWTSAPRFVAKPAPLMNQFALLDTGSDDGSLTDEDSYIADGIRIDGYKWGTLATA